MAWRDCLLHSISSHVNFFLYVYLINRVGRILQCSYILGRNCHLETNDGNVWIREIQIRKHPHKFLSYRTDRITSWREATFFLLQNGECLGAIQTNCWERRKDDILSSSPPTRVFWSSFVGSQQYLWWGRHIRSSLQVDWWRRRNRGNRIIENNVECKVIGDIHIIHPSRLRGWRRASSHHLIFVVFASFEIYTLQWYSWVKTKPKSRKLTLL